MRLGLGELGNEVAHFVGGPLVGDQSGVIRHNHHAVAQANKGDGPPVFLFPGVENDISGGVNMNEVRLRAVAFGIGL